MYMLILAYKPRVYWLLGTKYHFVARTDHYRDDVLWSVFYCLILLDRYRETHMAIIRTDP
jgi:hypothetical protein